MPILDDPDNRASADYLPCGPLDLDSVPTQVHRIDITKSSGLREMNSKILKIILLAVPELFTWILNSCLEKSIFPDSWKVAIVVPLPKKGNIKELNNIRPISLLPAQGVLISAMSRINVIELPD